MSEPRSNESEKASRHSHSLVFFEKSEPQAEYEFQGRESGISVVADM